MKNLFIIIVNALLFFFVATIIDGVRISGGTVMSKVFVGLLFGVMIMSVPMILRFFKISVTTGSRMLLALVLCFAFFFLIHSGVAGIGQITRSSIDLGIGTGKLILPGSLETLIVASIFSALASVGLQRLSEG